MGLDSEVPRRSPQTVGHVGSSGVQTTGGKRRKSLMRRVSSPISSRPGSDLPYWTPSGSIDPRHIDTGDSKSPDTLLSGTRVPVYCTTLPRVSWSWAVRWGCETRSHEGGVLETGPDGRGRKGRSGRDRVHRTSGGWVKSTSYVGGLGEVGRGKGTRRRKYYIVMIPQE